MVLCTVRPLAKTALTAVTNGAGSLDFAAIVSLAQLVIDDEILAMLERTARFIKMDKEALTFNMVVSVGPGGHFLDCEHSVRHCYRSGNKK